MTAGSITPGAENLGAEPRTACVGRANRDTRVAICALEKPRYDAFMQFVRSFVGVIALSWLGGCSSNAAAPTSAAVAPKCSVDADCASSAEKPRCEPTTGACVALPPGFEIGFGDGSASSVTLTELHSTGAGSEPVDLAFHPQRTDELWVVGYADDSVTVGIGVSGEGAKWTRVVDPDAMHFMHKPPALAMGTSDRWATCGDNDNTDSGGGDGSAANFMGPALFSTDLSIMGKATPGGLGSHEDMLHNTPFCRGIAHQVKNTFWAFNSLDKSLDKYNFNSDHGPGQEDHSDGEIYRYAQGQVKGADDSTPSQLAFDAGDGFLYVADTGNQRVVRLDTTKGVKGARLPRQMEPLKGNAIMKDTAVEVVVPPGTLKKPSGIRVRNDLVYVTDTATSTFYVFDKAGAEIRHLATDLKPGSLAGFTFGSDSKVYFTDRTRNRVLRIDRN